MKAFFLLLLGIISIVSTLTCPSDYINGGDGSCYLYFNYSYNRDFSYNFCADDNAYLIDIANAFQNSQLQQKIASIPYRSTKIILLGLTCLSNDRTSCAWDGTRQAINLTSYSNFAQGFPNLSIGPCVYMNMTTGLWYSMDCKSVGYPTCKYTPGVTGAVRCLDSHNNVPPSRTFAFRGKCYFEYNGGYNYFDGQKICASNCGTVASIHSLGEAMYIKSLALDVVVSTSIIDTPLRVNYTYIGLTSNGNGNYKWDDGTPLDYSNFGYHNYSSSNLCVVMAMVDAEINTGQWADANCGYWPMRLPNICKKDPINVCDYPTSTPQLPATSVKPITPLPTYCPTQYYSTNGTVTSPNYPLPYPSANLTCYNILNSTQSMTCVVFDVFNIRYPDSVTLYDGYASNGLVIAEFDAGDTASGVYCSKYHPSVYLLLKTNQFSYGSSNQGFSARFSSDALSLAKGRPTFAANKKFKF